MELWNRALQNFGDLNLGIQNQSDTSGATNDLSPEHIPSGGDMIGGMTSRMRQYPKGQQLWGGKGTGSIGALPGAGVSVPNAYRRPGYTNDLNRPGSLIRKPIETEI